MLYHVWGEHGGIIDVAQVAARFAAKLECWLEIAERAAITATVPAWPAVRRAHGLPRNSNKCSDGINGDDSGSCVGLSAARCKRLTASVPACVL